jgi:Tol biopolymer transport system component
MKRIALVMLAVTLLVGGPAAQDLERLFKAAVNTETVDRNCKGAIEQYKKVADGSNRALAAQALLRMAGCHQKSGDAEEQRIYQRLVTEFGDQRDVAAIARARLQPSRSDLRLRKVFTGAFMVGVSPDGRYLVHHNGLRADAVIVRDLTTGVERTLDTGRFFENGKFSADGRQLAYGQCGEASCEVRAVDLRADQPVPRRLYASEGAFVAPIDWSPDGKSIAVYVQRRADRVLQLGLLHVSDGTLQVLESMSWGGTITGFFSPDGRDLAYTRRIDEHSGASDIFLMDVQDRRQRVLVTNPGEDFPLGWTPDGRHLLFASDRSGGLGVWAQAVSERKPVGTATLVKANIGGDVAPVGMTRAGALFVGVRTFSQDVEVAAFDPASGRANGAPVSIRTSADRTWLPAWSPDGQSLAYVLVRNGSENTIGIRSTATADERELRLASQLDRVRSLAWTPDGRSLVGWGLDLRGRYGIFRIDASDGNVTPVVFRDPPPVRQFSWSPDGLNLRYPAQGALYEFDGQVERRLEPLPQPAGLRSPDGRWIARLVNAQGASHSRTLAVQSTIDGHSRELHRLEAPGPISDFRWARDGRALVLIHARTDASTDVTVVPIDGSAVVRLDFDANRLAKDFRSVELSPDRQRIAYIVGDDSLDVWSLENFLPLN